MQERFSPFYEQKTGVHSVLVIVALAIPSEDLKLEYVLIHVQSLCEVNGRLPHLTIHNGTMYTLQFQNLRNSTIKIRMIKYKCKY